MVVDAPTSRIHKILESYIKNKSTDEDRMISCNNYKLYSNTYLKFFKWVADKMQSNCISNANINFNSGVFGYKKIIKNLTRFHSHNLELS